ncbi:hypothetical protein F8568_034445 [Actinomadura sp. LD22]|uniref:Uncharacterized protein n=1 Tax=Actinomadura physcomitrii TaxID=2650748 RepID=A0A6I4MSV8_9ACTN|nr:hypothetical protein [Actinomadura physcomitrii]MWA05376.1 hypothetical protein [Actinomadura physcomitrii]
MDYQPYQPEVDRPLKDVSEEQAIRVLQDVMETLDSRLVQLASLLGAYGIRLDFSDESITKLEQWFNENVEPSERNPGQLEGIWYSIAHDIGLYFGELVINRGRNLKWILCRETTSNSFHRHVVGGIAGADGEPWYVDFEIMLILYGYETIDGKRSRSTFFPAVVHDVLERDSKS